MCILLGFLSDYLLKINWIKQWFPPEVYNRAMEHRKPVT